MANQHIIDDVKIVCGDTLALVGYGGVSTGYASPKRVGAEVVQSAGLAG